ncbi:MAG: hypothetical protein ABIP93_09955 [Gemmatimonadaceae bacterium]
MRFSSEVPNDSPCEAREFFTRKDARQLARDLLTMTQEAFSAAFKSSPLKRATLRD